MTAVLVVVTVLAVFGAAGWWLGHQRQQITQLGRQQPGRHRATGAGYTPPAADLPPIPSATRRQIRESGR